MRKSAWSVATCLETSARTVAAVESAVRAKEKKRMSECDEKQLPLIKPIESSGLAPNIFIEIRIRLPRSKSGPATVLTAKTLQARILMMVVRSLSSKGVNPGVEVTANATIHFLDGDDSQPVRLEPVGWVAV